ncbi:MAG TPA: PAS domain S-box protein [Anaerolineae bacterium]|nr:PAS domain S-box protein [Anaerolineae bacterium]
MTQHYNNHLVIFWEQALQAVKIENLELPDKKMLALWGERLKGAVEGAYDIESSQEIGRKLAECSEGHVAILGATQMAINRYLQTLGNLSEEMEERWRIVLSQFALGFSNYVINEGEKGGDLDLLYWGDDIAPVMMEMLPLGICVHVEGRVQYVNEVAVNLLQAKSATELIGEPIMRFVHEDYQQVVAQRVQRSKEEKRETVPEAYEKLLRLDGTVFEAKVRGMPIMFEGELGMLVIVQDISEKLGKQTDRGQHQMQLAIIRQVSNEIAAVRTLEDLTQTIPVLIADAFESCHVGLYWLEGEVLKLEGRAGCYEGERPLHTTIPLTTGIIGWVARYGEPFVCQDVRQEKEFAADLAALTETKSFLCLPIRIQKHTVAILDVHSGQYYGFNGNDMLALEAIGDSIAIAIQNARLYTSLRQELNERKRAEMALRQSEQRYRLVSELTSDFTYSLLVDVAERMVRVEWMTDAWWRILGYAKDSITYDILTKKIVDPVDHDTLKRITAQLQRGESSMEEIRVRTKEGESKWLRLHNRPVLDGMGKLVFVHGAGQDITKRKQVETVMQKTQRLESVGVLAGSVAHDFNNLLTAILMQNSLAQMKLGGEHPSWQNIETSNQIAEKAANLTRQLLAYARTEPVDLAPVDLLSFFDENSRLFEMTAGKKCKLVFDLPEELPSIAGNSGHVQQVIINLVTNAVEAYEGAEGEIRVTAERFDVHAGDHVVDTLGQAVRPNQYIRLSVADKGYGIPSENIQKLFDPFFTTKMTRRGLGLAAIQGIVLNHRGYLQVDTVEGEGATFIVLWPVSQPMGMLNGIEPQRDQLTGGKILIVDDDMNIRAALKEYLTMRGYQVLLAEDGEDGVTVFREHQEEVALVIIDLTMPIKPGDVALDEMRQLRGDLPAIIFSGYSQGKLLDFTDSPTYTEFLAKPFALDHLVARLEAILAG